MKIKTFLLSLIVMLFAYLNMQANTVTNEIAAKVAVNFYYQAINADQPTDFNSIKITNSYTVAENGITFYYIFNIKNGGFVIVSANDARNPILGYSFENNYSEENPSPEFTWWMSGYKDQISYLIENKVVADDNTKALWNEYSAFKPYSNSKTDITVGPLLLTLWDQGFPYNELCPPIINCAPNTGSGSGGHVYAGCVATAMGQVMNYYKYPLTGSSSHTYTYNSSIHGNFGTFTSTYSDSTYNWNGMPNQLSGSNIPVASLLYQLAISVNMGWGCDGSGAFSFDVPGALIAYFGYNSSTEIVSRSSYTQTNWENLIQQQINSKYPLYYSGQSSSGGHAFNLDGYKTVGTTTTYHFNWGWSGSQNGYFDINNINGYNDYQAMIINSYPDPSNGYPYNCSGQKTLTAMNGVFEDGSGYFDYQPNLNCSWLIDPINPSGTDHIKVTFDRFEMTDVNDILTIYDGENASAPVLATYHGGSTVPAYINSTSPKVFVTFTSDGAVNGGGWSLSYSTICITHCVNTQTLTQSTNSFDDGSGQTYNYSNNIMCKWEINPKNATYVKLKFNQLETEANNDKIKIYDDFSGTTLLGTFSGTTIPPDTITSNTGQMFIVFQTNANNTYPGWTVTYVSDGNDAGIQENSTINNISIFPNPTENNVKISFTVNALQNNIQWSVIDVVGKEIYRENIHQFIGEFNKSLDLSSYAKGIYIIQIKTDNDIYNKKIILK